LLKRVKLQRIYDIFSWRSFLAINWPVDDQGRVKPAITDLGDPNFGAANICPKPTEVSQNSNATANLGYPGWTIWKERYEVFKLDGSIPTAWGSPRTTIPVTTPPLTTTLPITSPKSMRILHITHQANSNLPLWDQNGNMVYYEILVNNDLFTDIISGTLYNIQGQIKLYTGGSQFRGVDFSYGKMNQNQLGAIALKLAWKIIDEKKGDRSERFYTIGACVLDKNQKQWVYKKVGLVGMHIAHKTLSSQQWVWSTFEQIDNVQVDDMEALAYANNGLILKPSFHDPYCDTCPVNVEPTPDTKGNQRTQVTRLIPIAQATVDLNEQVQELLKIQGSVWQYYELVGTQFALNSSVNLSSNQKPANPITNQSGGYPQPAYLVNSVIETYNQVGNQPAKDLLGTPSTDASLVFGSQSCINCHNSATLAIAKVGNNVFRLPGAGDFMFMLEKAQSNQ
jgi:hypothetical protein